MTGDSVHEEDLTADRILAFLEAHGAARTAHSGRSLLDHLRGTYEITRRWGQPVWIQHAALIHSVFGTEAYRRQLLPLSKRTELAALAGPRAERLAVLFARTPRRLLLAGTHRWAPGLLAGAPLGGEPPAPGATREELDALLLLHLANLAEQARAPDGSPALWLVGLRDAAEALLDSEAVVLPPFIALLAGLSPADESLARDAYRDGLADAEPLSRVDRLALAAAACPVLGEPCAWLALAAWGRRDAVRARAWAQTARHRLLGLGTCWDKRLDFEEWLTVTALLEEEVGELGSGALGDPRALLDELGRAHGNARPPGAQSRPAQAGGLARFQRYLAAIAAAEDPAGRLLYPDLERRPWWDPAQIPLALELQRHAPEIREEVLRLDPGRFMPESEPIARSGDWDVVFFYERGRRHAQVCEQCPVTTRVIEGDGALRTPAGLIYVSRMRPGTHIEPHRGPTNLRLRCHLGIAVPEGGCGIRVGEQSRTWTEGQCLVFDDSFEHEAWNYGGADRLVLIVDLWHPGLSPTEVSLLAGLHRYAAGYGARLERYWRNNELARGR